MTMSTPGGTRRDEDLPGAGRTTRRRQGASAARPKRSSRPTGKRKARMRGPLRTLIALSVVLLMLFGGLGAAHLFGSPRAELTPQLGLDLAGGRQIVLAPITEDGATVGPEDLDQAIDIIRRRVDGGGVTEAEVSRMGGNISVAIPGNPTPQQLEALSRSSQMRFRPVLVAQPVLAPGEELPTPRTLPLPPALQLEGSTPPVVEDSQEAPADDAEQTEGNRGGERLSAAGTPAASDAADATEAPEAPATEEPQTEAPPTPFDNPSDLAQITPEIDEQFAAQDCSGDVATEMADASDYAPMVTCNVDGTEKYILGPTELSGGSLVDATAGPETAAGGAPTGRWQVNLTFDAEGGQTFADITSRLFGYGEGATQNRFAMVLDGEVLSAPSVNSVISGGTAQITGGFTATDAELLANQLRFGALPISFETQTSEQISPTLGGEQLRWGIIAGAVGLLLVFVFMLFQYRMLGFVAIFSLIIAALLAYGAVTLLGWATNLRLTMAGVTGLIVSIGVTADSFIVYFERIRDEVRAGRPLRYAVDTGWVRARRTLIISDVVNLIAAGVLYALSEAGVAAFAFMLGLMTVIDLIVVFMFTHPLVSILANTRYFGEGRTWSGMEPERLGAKRSAYLGRGQLRDPEVIPAGSRRHTREELEGGVV